MDLNKYYEVINSQYISRAGSNALRHTLEFDDYNAPNLCRVYVAAIDNKITMTKLFPDAKVPTIWYPLYINEMMALASTMIIDRMPGNVTRKYLEHCIAVICILETTCNDLMIAKRLKLSSKRIKIIREHMDYAMLKKAHMFQTIDEFQFNQRLSKFDIEEWNRVIKIRKRDLVKFNPTLDTVIIHENALVIIHNDGTGNEIICLGKFTTNWYDMRAEPLDGIFRGMQTQYGDQLKYKRSDKDGKK